MTIRCSRRRLRGGWIEVLHTSECDSDGDYLCPCGFDPCEQCIAPGPTEDGVEYREEDGILYGRRKEETRQP
jgi:hypothetical protein